MTYKEALEYAIRKNEKLLATDPGFNETVMVMCKDGASFYIPDSFFGIKGKWLFIFAEHYAPIVIPHEDITTMHRLQRVG